MTLNEPPKELPRRGLAGVDRELDKLKAEKAAPRWFRSVLIGFALVVFVLPLAFVALYRVIDPPVTILMVQRALAGEDIAHRAVSIRNISPHLVRAVIAAEDSRFCQHDGFDVEAIEEAMAFNERQEERGSDRRRGASTISQQTAKNLFLWPQRSWVRKGLETYFTFLIELTWPKRRIMQAYLNAAEWGEGRFGAEAAARDLFGKSARDLTPREAARMAAVLPSPRKWRADAPGPYVRGRAATIEKRMQVVRNEGLDACALPKPKAGDRDRKPAPARERTPEPAPAPQVAAEDAPAAEAAPAETPALVTAPSEAPPSLPAFEPPPEDPAPTPQAIPIDDLPAEDPFAPPPEASGPTE